MEYTFKPGELVYVMTPFSGPLPAKLTGRVRMRDRFSDKWEDYLNVKMTTSRPAYPAGEEVYEPVSAVIPRHALHTRDHKCVVWAFGEPNITELPLLATHDGVY